MNPADDLPQLGSSPVDPAALAEAGVTLEELLTSLGLQLDPYTDAADVPADGWRVLRQADGAAFVGAPDPAREGMWFAGQGYPATPERGLHPHDEPIPLRPSPAERRAGLVMRWPSIVAADETATDFAVDIVNTGTERWMPTGDDFQTMGAFTRARDESYSFGYMLSGTPAAVPLEPGDYARVAVGLSRDIWHELEPGTVWLHAHSPGLGLHPEPLRIELTRERIELGRARTPRRDSRRGRAATRRMLTERIAAARAARAARPSLVAIAEVVADAESDAEIVERLAALLGCPADDASRIYHSPLSHLGPNEHGRMAAEIAQHEATLAGLDRVAPSETRESPPQMAD
ncbi:hypothetical protein [Microbacterium arborescens]|uniref:hypothetical protein n=1 Tax=Microbacterium arborescens TaxID=33883 RepID=UPI00277DA64D|nr:hypothetical protein [Microbacterium arborescens]MDQ1218308.1 hypothetical protein [Microbacterium arborescens]